jgi:DNA polymerase III delta prime subunit
LQRIAAGLQILHVQNVIHRNLQAEAIFFNPQLGPRSFRLGGFEWSVRLGQPALGSPSSSWATPPTLDAADMPGFGQETDWYAFGVTAARCLLNLEAHSAITVQERYTRTLTDIDKATARQLSDLERTFLQRLIDPEKSNRLTRGDDIVATIRDIISRLDRGAGAGEDDRSLLLVLNPNNCQEVVEQAVQNGFVPNDSDPSEPFTPGSLLHVSQLTSFVQRDLRNAKLYAIPGQSFYVLSGRQLTLTLTALNTSDGRTGTRSRTWELAYCNGVGEVRSNPGGSAVRVLPTQSILVRTQRQIHQDPQLRQAGISWERYLPTIEKTAELRASLERFHEFIRCTNQLELLIRDAEIFRYQIVEDRVINGKHCLRIKEVRRQRAPAPWCRIEGGLQEHLQREIDLGKVDSRLVILTNTDEDGLTMPRTQQRRDCWEVRDPNLDDGIILLERNADSDLASPPSEGCIRTYGMFGQISLVARRKRAIDRLGMHAYLLRSLSAPGQVYMDTGEMPLHVPLPVNKVDEAKQAVMQDILRVRPIYALQGPPGTGKTTLVSHLIRQILADDPVAQILITAQAHGAVDVLRAKVRDEAFEGTDQPLAVRLGAGGEDNWQNEGSVLEVSLRVLKDSIARISESENCSEVRTEWRAAAQAMADELSNKSLREGAGDFVELVRRGASLTYCTTSARDLEELAEGDQSFDWTILEEAGKAHGFDLALPLQAGHRWLLIGDPNQLPPYRFEDYLKGLERLDEAVDWLADLPARTRRLVDSDWIRSWKELDDQAKGEFVQYAKDWLNTFKRVLASCRNAVDGSDRRTIDASNGSMAGLLSGQYRMHPTIGDVISSAYYKEELVNRTADENGPKPAVVHPFVRPSGIAGKAIVWLDLPWAAREVDCEEQGPRTNHPRYRNLAEATAIKAFLGMLAVEEEPLNPLSLAVLSPYNQQVSLIRNQLKTAVLPTYLTLKQNLSLRSDGVPEEMARTLAHSVDSFQGNEADIIVVSLVRNNTLEPGTPSAIGFLKDAPRLNVLLSRAEQLLVLVGSWEFFRRQLEHVPIDDPKQELWHWKKVVTLLEEWFASGKAIKMRATYRETVE